MSEPAGPESRCASAQWSARFSRARFSKPAACADKPRRAVTSLSGEVFRALGRERLNDSCQQPQNEPRWRPILWNEACGRTLCGYHLVVDRLLKTLERQCPPPPSPPSRPPSHGKKCLKSFRAALSFSSSNCLRDFSFFSLSLSLCHAYRFSGNPTLNATLAAACSPKSICIPL